MGKKFNNLSNPSFKFISEYLFADNCTFIEFHALQKELTARNAQRDELMFSIKVRRPVILHTKLCNSLPLLYFFFVSYAYSFPSTKYSQILCVTWFTVNYRHYVLCQMVDSHHRPANLLLAGQSHFLPDVLLNPGNVLLFCTNAEIKLH